MKTHAALFLALLASAAHAGPRTSANYAVATDAADAGWKRTASASCTNDASLGVVVGSSTVAAAGQPSVRAAVFQNAEQPATP
jgi:hypothetical protein